VQAVVEGRKQISADRWDGVEVLHGRVGMIVNVDSDAWEWR